MHFRYTEELSKAFSNASFYANFVLAWLFIGGLFQITMVIMSHVN